VVIGLKEQGAEHDDLIFPLSNLAIVEAQLGKAARAEQLFRQALRAARIHNHRALAPILTDLADLRCNAGATAEGLRLLDEARPIMAKTYASEPWRTAWVDNVRGDCLRIAGDESSARSLLAASTPVILAKWSVQSHFGALAKARFDRAQVKS
jgi:hypothetical protein